MNDLDRADRQANIIAGLGGDISDIGVPAVSEWIRPGTEKARYTVLATVCFAGIVVNRQGAVKLFHLLPYMTRRAEPALLAPIQSEIVGGFFGSEMSFGTDPADYYTDTLHLIPIADQKNGTVTFNVLISPQDSVIMFSYGDRGRT